MKVSELVDELSVVAPTLSAGGYVPLMEHFWLFDGQVTTYNDRLAMSKPLDLGFDGTVQSLLLDMLRVSYQAGKIEFKHEPDKEQVSVRIGGGDQKNKFKSNSAEDAKNIFAMPKCNFNAPAFAESLGKARESIETCLLAVSSDQQQPERTGITIIPEDKVLSFYAFNNVALARCTLPLGETSYKGRITVPVDFWNIFLSLTKNMTVKDAKKSVLLSLASKEVQAKVDDVRLYAKTLPVDDPTDLRKIFNKHYTADMKANLVPLTADMWEAMKRNLTATKGDAEVFTKLTVKGNELRMTTNGKSGMADDVMDFNHPDVGPINVRVEQLTKAEGLVERMSISEDVVALVKDARVYVVSSRA